MANPFDKFDGATKGGNPFDRFDGAPMMDFSRPDTDIRSDIDKLPDRMKNAAHNAWAEHRVKETYKDSIGPSPELAKGIPIIGPLLDEAAAGIVGASHYLSNGQIGRPYEEALAYERAKERAASREHPIWDVAGKTATGITTGGPIFGRIAPAQTAVGRVGQGIAIGAPVGFAEGFGAGEGSFENRVKTGEHGAEVGAVVGGLLPVGAALATRAAGAVSDLVSPTITRLRRGPEEAADEILARRIADEGSTPAMKRLELQRGQAHTAQLGPNSQADLPETIADTSDAMRRLTGSLYRAGGEGGNFIKSTLDARQRGPENRFGAGNAAAELGQMDRVLDATERALLIRSSDSARRTEQQLVRDQARQGRQLYDAARNNSEAFNLQPVLDGLAIQAQQYPPPFRARLLRALNLFRDDSPRRMPVNNIERFDASKKALDDMIEIAQRQGQGNLTRELTIFKSSLLDAVHMPDANGIPTRNRIYADARNAWGSAAENREAIELGRSALRDGSEVGVENYQGLTPGQQSLFRLGFIDSLRNAISTRKPGDDITQLFQQRRVQELMNAIIPTPRGRNAVYADRAERFGDLLNREQRMVQTRNEVLGNSKTAQRQSDDMQYAGDALANMWDRFRHSPSLFNMGIEAVGASIRKIFGYRQDVALALAQRLLETDPTVRNQILRRLAVRGGTNRFAQFANALDRSGNALIGAISGPVSIESDRKSPSDK